MDQGLEPMIVAESPLNRKHSLRSVVLKEALGFFVCLAHEGDGRSNAPSVIVGLLVQLQTIKGQVGINRQGIETQNPSLFLDRIAPHLCRFVEFSEDLTLSRGLCDETRRHSERLNRFIGLPCAIAVNETKLMPKFVLQLTLTLAGDTVKHLSVGS